MQQAEEIYHKVIKVLDEETKFTAANSSYSHPSIPISWCGGETG
jgi:hypothetical protein